MSSAFDKMKKKRNGSSLDTLKTRMEKENKNGRSADERFWKLSTDKASNGFAEIRFLQPTDGEDFPYIKRHHHAFKVGAKWFWKNCPTTIGLDCPVCEANSELWATEIEANKTIVRRRKRQTKYIANILVINDPAVPENNGKVFLFEFGKKIFDKILDKTDPQFADEAALNPFDFWEGASFKLKCREVEGYPNYDKSEFTEASVIADSDEGIDKIWSEQSKLGEFIADSEFESYDKLKVAFDKALGVKKTDTSESIEDEPAKPAGYNKPTKNATPELDDKTEVDTGQSDDADLDYYENLLDD